LKRFLISWGERYLYTPSFAQKILSFLLLPLTGLYCLGAYIRYLKTTPKKCTIPVVSIGNLTVGGSGKTPVMIELAKSFERPAVILRGYGRNSQGMVVVKDREILCDIYQSGDEAMLYAQSLPHAVVIVSEKRERAINEAKSMGCDVALLDDGYGKHQIEKLDLLIKVQTSNMFCLPSGPYREKLWPGKSVHWIQEDREFHRNVTIENPTQNMVLVTAIARPQRLDPYLPSVSDKIYFEDHHFFSEFELSKILEESGATSLLVTQKDLVKMSAFNLPLSVLKLEIKLDSRLINTVLEYVNAKKD